MILKTGALTLDDFACTNVSLFRAALVAPHLVVYIQMCVSGGGRIWHVSVSHTCTPLAEDVLDGRGQIDQRYLSARRVPVPKSFLPKGYNSNPSWEQINRFITRARLIKRIKIKGRNVFTIPTYGT